MKSGSLQSASLIAMLSVALTGNAYANYSCGGKVTYLGVDMGGSLTVAVSSTPIHKICNLNDATGWTPSVAVCKSIYAQILSAKLAGKNIVIYYSDNIYSCSSLPSWGSVPSAYFVQGPDD